LQVFGETKVAKPHVMEIFARIIRQYDVVAVQEIRSRSQDTLPKLIEAINAGGAQYDFVIGPRLGRTVSKEQYAFIFDRATIEVDRNQTYTVEDRDDVLHREPLVAWFRVRGPPTNEAFTFTLVNIHVDPDDVRREVNVLDDVFRAVRDDGREEDDVILIGDLNTDDRHLGQIGQSAAIVAAISGVPTTVRGGAQLDNLLFDEMATKEFTGRAGVFDFLREYNFTLEQAAEVSDHLPVWAEFSAFEGGMPGRVAERSASTSR
jgi:endonuclease/exonuclease/phosphatase family metal-dependent hydrolase